MVLFVLSTLALADIPPPEGYVEQCTVANHQSDTVECVSCDAYHGGREPCEALEAAGYTQACRTSGASVWDEIMCRPKGSGTDPIPAGLTEAKPEGDTPPAPPATPAEPEVAPASMPVKKAASDESSSKCSTLGTSAAFPALLLGLLALRRRRSGER